VRPTFEELKTSLMEISRRLGGQVPPRHNAVELRSPEEIREAAGKTGSKAATEISPGRDSGSRTSRTTMIAVGIGVTIGIALGVVVAAMSM